jgi:hypothetical protein
MEQLGAVRPEFQSKPLKNRRFAKQGDPVIGGTEWLTAC